MKVLIQRRWLITLFASAMMTIIAAGIVLVEIAQEWPEQESTFHHSAESAAWEKEHLRTIDREGITLLPSAREDRPSGDLSLLEQQRLEALRRRIEDRFGIIVRMYDSRDLERQFGVTAVRYPVTSLQEHLRNLYAWLSIYPPDYPKSVGLKTIYLFKGWEMNTIETAGFLIDRSTIGMQASPHALHHELFHIADINDGGLENENARWIQIKFGKDVPEHAAADDKFDALKEGANLKERPQGYVSWYGQSGGIDEDQATTAEAMLLNFSLVRQWAKKDPALAASIAELQRFYALHSNGLMDAQFWNDLSQQKTIDANYWEHRAQ